MQNWVIFLCRWLNGRANFQNVFTCLPWKNRAGCAPAVAELCTPFLPVHPPVTALRARSFGVPRCDARRGVLPLRELETCARTGALKGAKSFNSTVVGFCAEHRGRKGFFPTRSSVPLALYTATRTYDGSVKFCSPVQVPVQALTLS